MNDPLFMPGAGLAPNLIPNPPGEIPEAQSPGNAEATSPFLEAQDVDQIIRNLTLDRPLKLFIPNQEKYPEWQFRIINNIPQEIADAHNKGFKEVTIPELTALFADLVAGTDKKGAAYRPLLMARPRAVAKHIEKLQRQQLASQYAGMDPKNREFNGTYTENAKDVSKAAFQGAGFRIKV